MQGLSKLWHASNWLWNALNWLWMLAATFCIAGLTCVLFNLLIVVPVIFGVQADPDTLEALAWRAGTQGAWVTFGVLTSLFAWWIAARKAGTRPLPHGIIVGAGAALAVLILIKVAWPPLGTDEVIVYPMLGLVTGCLGGEMGRRKLQRKEAVLQAQSTIAGASDDREIAAAIYDLRGGPDVAEVILYRAVDEAAGSPSAKRPVPKAFLKWTSYPSGDTDWPAGHRLDREAIPQLDRLPEARYAWLGVRDLPAAQRVPSKGRQARSALLIPLTDADGSAPFGLLLIAFTKSRRPLAFGELANSKLQDYLALSQLTALAQRIAVGQERDRWARELHDTLVQDFTSIDMNLEVLDCERLPERTRLAIEKSRRKAREGAVQARRLMRAGPASPGLVVDQEELSRALERTASKWSEECGIEARVRTVGELRPLLVEVRQVILRVIEEGCFNVRKHARADRVEITLAFADGFVSLDLKDNGVGFDPNSTPGHPAEDLPPAGGTSNGANGGFGLGDMRKQVQEVGGSLFVLSGAGQGTRLLLKVPTAYGLPATHADLSGANERRC